MADLDPLNLDFASKHPDAFAKVLGRAEPDEISRLLKKMPAQLAASVVAKLPVSRAGSMTAADPEAATQWLTDATFDDAVKLLGLMPRSSCLAVINSLTSKERRRKLLRFLNYPAHSVGTLVSDVLVRIAADTSAADALQELRALPADDPGPIVVLHPDGRYFGVLNLWPMLSRDPPAGHIRDYVSRVPALYPETSLTEAAQDRKWQSHDWLAVTDHEERLLGGISRRQLLEAVGGEADRAPQDAELYAHLLADMFRVLGALVDRILNRRAVP